MAISIALAVQQPLLLRGSFGFSDVLEMAGPAYFRGADPPGSKCATTVLTHRIPRFAIGRHHSLSDQCRPARAAILWIAPAPILHFNPATTTTNILLYSHCTHLVESNSHLILPSRQLSLHAPYYAIFLCRTNFVRLEPPDWVRRRGRGRRGARRGVRLAEARHRLPPVSARPRAPPYARRPIAGHPPLP